jgi:hypothetical protein
MRGPFPTIAALLGILTAVWPAQGQVLPEHVQSVAFVSAIEPVADPTPYRENPGLAALGAILGGALGFIAGGMSGAALVGDNCGGDWCGLEAAFTGALVGEVLGIGLGAHLGNGWRGSALPALAASGGVLGAALILGGLGGLTEGSAPFVPILQIAGAVIAETQVARARARR